ncbi:hypothetical protein CYMTET_13121 [Cymbomonas tetramitiformis]|uniref:tRNA (guanine(46)-N(7))-methyltransferase n=1 Tax=Cymbomonas tetramitiformis TaxID=36881 RepID=A0AAE0KXQ9_9CHLO|nr:hypothetical protein CYMTET_26643 [Cymbomonas tetramitiformis]KAK3278975.1 hypothetical protein CYMTET_13121 [Cymbomonas tetramitiformis]|eukprot:gene26837-32988_t
MVKRRNGTYNAQRSSYCAVVGDAEPQEKKNPSNSRDGGDSPFAVLGIKSSKVEGIRVRQHVNPLKRELQVPNEAPDWAEVFHDPSRPLLVDVGCGSGRFLLMKAKESPDSNFLGLDIRTQLTDRSSKWAEELGIENVAFIMANATISFNSLLDSYPGPITVVSIQYPDPHFKKRHHKRRVVQAQLVEAITSTLEPGACVFLQSDVLEVAEHMRDQFERYAAAAYSPAESLHGTPEELEGRTFLASSSDVEAEGGAQAVGEEKVDDASSSEDESGDKEEVESTWHQWGWLRENPMQVPTEREMYVLGDGLPVYRIMLERR